MITRTLALLSIFLLSGCVGVAVGIPSETVVEEKTSFKEISQKWGSPYKTVTDDFGAENLYFQEGFRSINGIVLGLIIPIPLAYPVKAPVHYRISKNGKIERVYKTKLYGGVYGCMPGVIVGVPGWGCGELYPLAEVR